MRYAISICFLLTASLAAQQVRAREWHDETKKYSFTADLIASTDEEVVLQREDGSLIAIPIGQLSKEDREYLESKEAAQLGGTGDAQTWTMKSGLEVVGSIVAYGRKEVVIQRKRGKIYVNDRVFDNLPEIYQRMIPRVVGHFEGREINDREAFDKWVLELKGFARRYQVDGVVLELENGDEYAVPFLFFSDEDLKILEPGWERWLAGGDNVTRRQQEELYVRAQAEAYQRDRQYNQQVAAMQLLISAADAGIVELWEVRLLPHYPAPPMVVVVPGRNSQQASRAALMNNPNCTVAGVRKLN